MPSDTDPRTTNTPEHPTELLPIENLDEGLYLWPQHTPVTTVSNDEGTLYFVGAVAFMKMQRERDNYRRALALINAWRITPERGERTLAKLLADAGFSDADAQAMASIIAAVRAGI